MRLVAAVFASLFVFFSAYSQDLGKDFFSEREVDKLLENDKVSLNFPDSTINFTVFSDIHHIKAKHDRYYYWFRAGAVRCNKGGYDGKLLNGNFKVFYSDMNLKREGKFKKGLKNGQWLSWYPSGEIEYIEHWKKGLLNGKVSYYRPNGVLVYSQHYTNGVAHKKKLSKEEKELEKAAAKSKKDKGKAKKDKKEVLSSQQASSDYYYGANGQAQDEVKKKKGFRWPWKKKDAVGTSPDSQKISTKKSGKKQKSEEQGQENK